MSRSLLVAVALSALALPGCVAAPEAPPRQSPVTTAVPAMWRQSALYFGMQRRDGRAVSELEWTGFVEEVITPRFPDGLTILMADGQWRTERGLIQREPSRVVTVVYPLSDAAQADSKLTAIGLEYAARFDQEAVMRVDTAADAILITTPAKP